jgi:hypothetical protein
MRVESAVTSVSWIPSEAVAGLAKMGFTAGAVRYDDPPPDRIKDLAALHAAERFRFANHLAAWAEVQDGKVVGAGYTGRGYINCTRVYLGGRAGITFQPAEFPELRAVTDCVVAVAGRDQVDRDRLAELAAPRHREDLPDR